MYTYEINETHFSGDYITPLMELAAVAAAEQQGYDLTAAELVTVDFATNGEASYEFITKSGEHIYIEAL